ncbi:hypothetical protein [Streptomyces sp. AC512_CC834]|uniref:hypothetical protein n=1 Tax=Streptomyces sp. AC512_CC834 TaxID=2823691 RepID=UPI001C26D04B|nr:hypothetical protein [Streptomyces sp. AC512_CC834]
MPPSSAVAASPITPTTAASSSSTVPRTPVAPPPCKSSGPRSPVADAGNEGPGLLVRPGRVIVWAAQETPGDADGLDRAAEALAAALSRWVVRR